MEDKEKRKHQRIPIAVLLDLYTPKTVVHKGQGFISNISMSGLALESQEIFDIGEKFLLRFTLTNKHDFDLVGEIIRIEKGVLIKRYGVKFKRIGLLSKIKMKRFILAKVKKER